MIELSSTETAKPAGSVHGWAAGSTSDLTQNIGDAPVRLTDNVPVRLAGGVVALVDGLAYERQC